MANLIKTASKMATSAGIQALGQLASGGEVAKCSLTPCDENRGPICRGQLRPVTFMFNPAKLKLSNFVRWTRRPDPGSDSAAKTHGSSEGRKLDLGNVWFDTFETRKNVRTEYIDAIEALAQRDHEGDHAPPYVLFQWGDYTNPVDSYNNPLWVIEKLDVEYTMFLNDGTPVRANVSLTLRDATPPEEQQSKRANRSPDHAKLVTLHRGETLQTVAYEEYDDPGEWRRIADANNIDDPMNVPPGTRLLIPPILK